MNIFVIAVMMGLWAPFAAAAELAPPQCLSLFQRQHFLRVESGPVFERKTEDEYIVTVIEKGFEFEASLDRRGRLTIAAYLSYPEWGMRSHLKGNELFTDMIQHFGTDRIKVIIGRWVDGTNYDHFFKSISEGLSYNEAAATTWTGRQAALHGYTHVQNVSVHVDKMTGMKRVHAEFTR